MEHQNLWDDRTDHADGHEAKVKPCPLQQRSEGNQDREEREFFVLSGHLQF